MLLGTTAEKFKTRKQNFLETIGTESLYSATDTKLTTKMTAKKYSRATRSYYICGIESEQRKKDQALDKEVFSQAKPKQNCSY